MKILNFGSLNIDYIYQVEHFVLPGETISANALVTTAGGKGLNQSVALARAGVKPYHAGAVGETDQHLLINLLADNGVDTGYIQVVPGVSGHAIIQVNKSGQNCIVLYGGANQQISEDFIDRVLSNFGKDDILLLQNETAHVPYMIEAAHQKGMHIYFNPSPLNFTAEEFPMSHIHTLILNEVEGEQLTGQKSAQGIIDTLLYQYPEMRIVLTLGAGGVEYADKKQRAQHGIYKVPVVDTTAAGDTFTGFYLASIYKGMDINDALKHASAAASIAVSRLGAARSIPCLDEVLQFLD